MQQIPLIASIRFIGRRLRTGSVRMGTIHSVEDRIELWLLAGLWSREGSETPNRQSNADYCDGCADHRCTSGFVHTLLPQSNLPGKSAFKACVAGFVFMVAVIELGMPVSVADV